MSERALCFLVLFALGAGWGATVPLVKIAVSTGHQPLGLIFWQLVVVVLVLSAITLIRRKPIRLDRQYLRLFVVVALTGAVLPDVIFYIAAMKLQGGVLSIILSSSPMFSLVIALMLGNDRFSSTLR